MRPRDRRATKPSWSRGAATSSRFCPTAAPPRRPPGRRWAPADSAPPAPGEAPPQGGRGRRGPGWGRPRRGGGGARPRGGGGAGGGGAGGGGGGGPFPRPRPRRDRQEGRDGRHSRRQRPRDHPDGALRWASERPADQGHRHPLEEEEPVTGAALLALALSAQPSPMRLGSDASAVLMVMQSAAQPALSVSVGRVEAPRSTGEGTWEAQYVPPDDGIPQVAIVMAVGGGGGARGAPPPPGAGGGGAGRRSRGRVPAGNGGGTGAPREP